MIIALIFYLFISCQAMSNIPSSQSYKVSGLEKYGAVDNMYAGLMPLELSQLNGLGSFFFWLAKQRQSNQPKPNSLVVWVSSWFIVYLLLVIIFCILA
jgi:hypothetical protein